MLEDRMRKSALPFETLPHSYQKLTRLDLSNGPIEDHFLSQWLERAPSLRPLNAAFCEKLKGDFGNLSHFWPLQTLRCLDLKGALNITDGGLQALVQNSDQITHLDLTSCQKLSDDAISEVFAKNWNLHSLSLSANGHFTSCALKNLSPWKIAFFDISPCLRFSSDALKSLLCRLPYIAELHLRDFSQKNLDLWNHHRAASHWAPIEIGFCNALKALPLLKALFIGTSTGLTA